MSIEWAVGLFEGEGCVHLQTATPLPVVSVGMTDEDVVRKFHQAIGFGKVYGPYVRGNSKPMFYWKAWGKDASKLKDLLYEQLSPRRQQQFDAVLSD